MQGTTKCRKDEEVSRGDAENAERKTDDFPAKITENAEAKET
jgi:hypothetical protein